MTLVKVEVSLEVEGRKRALLGYSVADVLDGDDQVVLGRTIAACYEDALADASLRMTRIAFHEVAGELQPEPGEAAEDAPRDEASPDA